MTDTWDVVVVGALQSGKDVRLAAGAEDVAEAYGRKLRPLLSTLGFTGKPGEVLKLNDPFPITIDPAALVR